MHRFLLEKMTEEQQRLVEDNIALAHHVVWNFKSTGVDMELDDLRSLAYLGLVKAAIKFDKDRGCAFSTFAVQVMTNEIRLQLRSNRKHKYVTTSLDAEMVPGEDMVLADIIPDRKDNFEELLFAVNMEQNQRSLNKLERCILRTVMQNPDIGQAEIGSKHGLSQSYISRILKGIKQKVLVE